MNNQEEDNMEKYIDDLLNNSFLIVIQSNNEDNLKSHMLGFKSIDVLLNDNFVEVFPNYDINNGNDFVNHIKFLYHEKTFKSISLAVVDIDLYCKIFEIERSEYNQFIKCNSKELCVEEEWGWFEYYDRFTKRDYYRIPKELVLGSIKYNKDKLIFQKNENYYMNLSKEEKEDFIKSFKKLILNEIVNYDYENEYPYSNVKKL